MFITGSRGFLGESVSALFPDAQRDLNGLDFSYQRNIRGTVIHLACPNKVAESIKNPEKYYNNSLDLIRFIRNNNVDRMIYMSTGSSSIYGDRWKASEEDANFNTCTNPYGTAKIIAENIIRQMVPSYCILRLANVVGANALGVMSNVHAHLMNDNPIRVFGDRPMREFVHIHNVMDTIKRVVEWETEGTYNIGSEAETNIRTLADWYGAERDVPIEVVPGRIGDHEYHTTMNCDAAMKAGLLTRHQDRL